VNSQTVALVVAAVVIIAIAVAAWWYVQRERRARLRSHFGPEYDRTVREAGSPASADAILESRARRVKKLDIQPLTREQADSFEREWQRIQALFVDDPDGAVAQADQLVTQVMTARRYPVEDFDARAADLSVHHAHVVENYRVARTLALKRQRGEAGTEELRQAVVNYRALFEDLLKKDDEGASRRRAS